MHEYAKHIAVFQYGMKHNIKFVRLHESNDISPIRELSHKKRPLCHKNLFCCAGALQDTLIRVWDGLFALLCQDFYFGSSILHTFLGGREVKCARTQSQKYEAGKVMFERELVDWLFFYIWLMVYFYSNLLVYFSQVCPLHKASWT